MFFVSTYLGRSPEALLKYKSRIVSVCVISWMFAMFILQQYTQTEITASRSVPALSAGMKSATEFMSRLDSGSILPCVHFITSDIIDKLGIEGSRLKSLRHALRKCGNECVTDNFNDCFPLAEAGTHALVAECSTVQARSRFGSWLVASDEALVSFLMCYPTHPRFPRRHQQRRLLRALHESGLYTKYLTKEVPPPISGDLASFDIPFTEYVVVYALGCGLSLVAFGAEVLWQQCGRARRRLVPQICKWLHWRADGLPSVDSLSDPLT
ncbi:uncharacterized protein LOC125945740 [Dermacentor silvarum]|uniref:uncharacterized protein LOC125945740 n=1 Tax=Dermacentor silvarum TaxID=543639 RepID=UPI002100E243|nr:uncharacterized protein LOC125945740 [Dermacentor silvarum]